MVKIYTRKGDDGTTSLWYGGRVHKDDLRTEAYGTLDEAASALGLARALCEEERLAADLLQLQNELFVAGAELATAPEARDRLEEGVSRVSNEMVERMERQIDFYMDQVALPPQFVIPGGNRLSAQLDIARTVLRRAERRIATVNRSGALEGSPLPAWANRASDLLFAMARYADVPAPELFKGRHESEGERG